MDFPLPPPIVYAGLGGVLLALVVATALQKWQAKVFFLLALRLAIGWHFLFEGLHKIHSHMVGPTDTNRPFTSEPYFRAAPTAFGAMMRRQFDDPAAVFASHLTPPRPMTAAEFDKLSADEQAALCPPEVARKFDALRERAAEAVRTGAEKDLAAADKDEPKALQDAKTEDEKGKVRKKFAAAREDARKRAEGSGEIAPALITAAKAKYARWVYGVEGRPAKVKFLTGEATLTGPQRLAHLEWLRGEARAAEERRGAGLGTGPYEQKRTSELRTELMTAEADLAKDATGFAAELMKELNGGKAVEEEAATGPGERMDKVTMWFITVVGAFLLLGVFTRASCVLAAGFLIATYLTHPPVPWFPLPPNTEGNPLFVNKNVIEALALLTLACFPTGRWLGFDALLARLFNRRRPAATG